MGSHDSIGFAGHSFTKVDGVWRANFFNLSKSVNHLLLTTTSAQKDEGYEKLKGLSHVCRHTPEHLSKLRAIAHYRGRSFPSLTEWTPLTTPYQY